MHTVGFRLLQHGLPGNVWFDFYKTALYTVDESGTNSWMPRQLGRLRVETPLLWMAACHPNNSFRYYCAYLPWHPQE